MVNPLVLRGWRMYTSLVTDTVPIYPLAVHLGHSLFCIASFRQWRQGQTKEEPSWMHNLVCSYFCFGFGGSSSADYIINSSTPMNLMSSRDIGVYWFLCYLAVYWSPFDIVYRLIAWPKNPVRIIIRGLESIDVMTTCTARVDKAMVFLPLSRAAPFLAGFITWVTGSFFRTMEYRGRIDQQIEVQDPPPKLWFATPGLYGGVSRGIIFTLAYYWFGKLLRGGLFADRVRLWCTTIFVVAETLDELVPSFDPFAMLSALTRGLLTGLARTLWLGRYSHAKKIDVDSKKALGSRLRRAPENEEKSE